MDAPTSINSKSRIRSGALMLLLAAFATCISPSTACGAEKTPGAKRLVAQPLATPETASAIARRQTGGRVLSVTPLEGGQRGYRIRLLLDGGRVTTVLVDAQGSVRKQR